MKYCPGCGNSTNDNARFCSSCGRDLADFNNNEYINRNPRVNTNMDGDDDNQIVRCPNCGSTIKYMSLYCEFCGAEQQQVHNVYSIKLFAEKVSRLHSARATSKANVFASAFGFGKKDPAEEELISMVTDFQIPNSVGDITEFMIFAASNINPVTFNEYGMNQSGAKSLHEWSVMKRESQAWFTKMEQAYNKASVFFGNTLDFEKINIIYHKTRKEIEEARSRGRRLFRLAMVLCFAPIVLLSIWYIVEKVSDSNKNNPEYTVSESNYVVSDDYLSKSTFDFDSLDVDRIYPQSDYDSPLIENITTAPELIYNTLGSENKLKYRPYVITGKVIATFENNYEAYDYFEVRPNEDDELKEYYSFVIENEYGKIWICDLASADVKYFKKQINSGKMENDEWHNKFVNEFGGYRRYEYPVKGEKVAILALYIGFSQKNNIATCYFGINQMYYDWCLDN